MCVLASSAAWAESEEEISADEEEEVEVEVREPAKPRRKVKNEIYFRAGVAHVEPNIKSGGVTLEPAGIVKLAAPMEPVKGGIEAESANIFAATIGFAPAVFGGYVAIETIIGVPKKAKLRARGDLANMSLAPSAAGIPTGIPALGSELGEATAVPPMMTIVGRAPALGPIRFYAGAGASVLFIRDARVTNKVLTEVATPKLEISPAVGFVGQVGVDVHLFGRFYARLDFKKLWFGKSESRITNVHVKTTIPLLETVHVGSVKSETQATPTIVQLGIGATF